MNAPGSLFAYFGPDTVLPVTSLLATLAGLVVMFGRQMLLIVVGACRLVLSGKVRTTIPDQSRAHPPHEAPLAAPHLPDRARVDSANVPREPSLV